APHVAFPVEPDGPGEAMAVSLTDGTGVAGAPFEVGGRVGDDLERRLLPGLVGRMLTAGVGRDGGERRLCGGGGMGTDGDVPPRIGAGENEVAVVDRGGHAPVADGNAVDDLGNADLPELFSDLVSADSAELGRIDSEDVPVVLDESADGRAHDARV